jgi:hypothetical protein
LLAGASRQWVARRPFYFGLCLTQVAVLSMAACGLFGAAHREHEES